MVNVSSYILCVFHLDINECNLDDNGCQHICVNTEGTYHCECFPGFELDPDGFNCSGRFNYEILHLSARIEKLVLPVSS